MKPGVPWSVKGIEPQARDAAKDAARRAGLTLGQWLNQVILDGEVAEERAAPAPPRAARHGASDMDALAARLDAMNDRLEELTDTNESAPAAMRAPTQRGLTRRGRTGAPVRNSDQIADRLDRSDAHIHALRSDLDNIAEMLANGPAPRDDGALAALERALFEVVDHIELTDKRNGEVLKTIQGRLSDLAVRVQGEDGAEQSATHEAILSLEARIGELARRVEERDQHHVERDHSALEVKLAELATKVDRASERSRSNPAIESLEARLNQVTSKLNVAERLMTPQTDFNQFKSEVGKLREEVARVREPTKPALVHAIETRINSLSSELSSVRSGAATNAAVAKLGERLDTIAARLSDTGSGRETDERISSVENRLGEIASRLEAAIERDAPHPQINALERQVGELTRQVESGLAGGQPDPQFDALQDRVAEIAARVASSDTGGSGDALPALQALEAQVNDISVRLGSAERHFSVLESIESNLSELFNSIDATRQASVDAAEQAAFNAAQRLVTQGTGSGDVAAGDALAALERGLAEAKTQTTAADRHNQETLEAIHDTLKRVIERLGNLEAGASTGTADAGFGGAREHELAPDPDRFGDYGSDPAEGDGDEFGDFRLPPLPELSPTKLPPIGDEPGEPPARTPRGQSDEPVRDDTSERAAETTEFSRAYDAPAASGHNDDFIAAARRAALAANQAQEAQDAVRRGGGNDDASGKGSGGRFRGRRRTLLFVAAALLVAAGALSMSGIVSIDLTPDGRAPALSSASQPSPAGDLLDGARQDVIEPANQTANLFQQDQGAGATQAAPATRALGPGVGDFVIADPAGDDEEAEAAQITIKPPAAPISGESLMTPSPAIEERPASGSAAERGIAAVVPDDDAIAAQQLSALASAPDPGASLLPGRPAARPAPTTLEQAAEDGDARAQFELAARFADGRAGHKDFAAAALWYQRAAAQGLAPAQYRLGALYEKGQGVAQDKSAARIWYQRAAEQGNLKAMHNLAVLLAGGVTGGADYARAARWFLRAAELGLADSQYNLAVLHERGLGVEQDLGAAYKWFSIAAAKGDQEAERRMNELAGQLDAATLARGRAAYQAWQAAPLDHAANFVELPETMTTDGPSSAAGADAVIAQAQSLLAELGYDPGPADGMMGPRTREAISAFQRERGLPETGVATPEVVDKLRTALAG